MTYIDRSSRILEMLDVEELTLYEEDHLPFLKENQMYLLERILKKNKEGKVLFAKDMKYDKNMWNVHKVAIELIQKEVILGIDFFQLVKKFHLQRTPGRLELPDKLDYATDYMVENLQGVRGGIRPWSYRFDNMKKSYLIFYVGRIAIKKDSAYIPGYHEIFSF